MTLITIWIPDGESSTFEQDIVANGAAKKQIYQARMHNSHRVVDVPPGFFKILLASSNGLLWQRLNPRAIEWIGEMSGSNQYQGQPFPDEGNPPIAPVATEAAPPVMVKLRAPEGATHYSHEGTERKIGKDGHVTVTGQVAVVLRSHGFR